MSAWVAGAVIVGGVAGAAISSDASRSASNKQADAAKNATNTQQGMFNSIQGNMQPFVSGGQQDFSQLQQYMNADQTGGPGGAPGLLHTFGPQDLQANLAPNYQFQLGQGMGMLQNQNAATGGAGGGNAFAGEQAFAQNTAASAYQNAYNNYQNNQNAIYSRLGNLAQLGQASGTNTALGGSAFGQGISNTMVGLGNAQAAGIMGQANAYGQGLNSITSGFMYGNMSPSANSLNYNGATPYGIQTSASGTLPSQDIYANMGAIG